LFSQSAKSSLGRGAAKTSDKARGVPRTGPAPPGDTSSLAVAEDAPRHPRCCRGAAASGNAHSAAATAQGLYRRRVLEAQDSHPRPWPTCASGPHDAVLLRVSEPLPIRRYLGTRLDRGAVRRESQDGGPVASQGRLDRLRNLRKDKLAFVVHGFSTTSPIRGAARPASPAMWTWPADDSPPGLGLGATHSVVLRREPAKPARLGLRFSATHRTFGRVSGRHSDTTSIVRIELLEPQGGGLPPLLPHVAQVRG
jgi:hypothetical protein